MSEENRLDRDPKWILEKIATLREDLARTHLDIAYWCEKYSHLTGKPAPGSFNASSMNRTIDHVHRILREAKRGLTFLEIKAKLIQSGIRFNETDLKKSLKSAITRGHRIVWVNKPEKIRIITDEDRFLAEE